MKQKRFKKGTVQVFTGSGKGKTTAALGCGLRAAGHGFKVLMIQFMKGRRYGELDAVKHVPGFEIIQFGRDSFVEKGNPCAEDVELARKGFDKAREALGSDEYDMIILDEVNVAVDYGLIPLDHVLNLLEQRPPHVELILTGRYAHEKLRAAAHTVSEMLEVKHHYVAGVEAREGIEY
ncbi:MAG: cob(I)yrinic acid a,c-diamide adenosyltransferase [Candidatus Eisenbacteria bacterium]|nr:cob(I)yrinic acid a,c-diamide adenosyltransferase [Candidatus Eisenbacteria bacterium]